MRPHRVPSLVVLCAIAPALIACGAVPRSGDASVPPTQGPARTAPLASAVAVSPAPATRTPAPDEALRAWLLVGRRGEAGLQLVEWSSGDVQDMAVPDGAPATNWHRVVSATADGKATIIRDDIVQPGNGGPELRLDGHWRLPAVGLDPIPAGRSLDGSTIVLVEGPYDASAGISRFAIVQHHLANAPTSAGDAPLRLTRMVELNGAFEYDTLSPDGAILYVVQHLDSAAGGRYQVRAIDVATGVMRDAVIVDKTHPDEKMAGAPVAQVRRADGLVLTLYRGPEHPFIHALASAEAWAVCIDLPRGNGDPAAGLDWGLAPSSDNASVYAVNAGLGLAVEIDPSGLAVRRSASIGTNATAPIVLAKFGHNDVGPVGRRLVASPDGSLLFAAGTDGITAIRTRDLATARHDLAGSAIEGLGIGPDGRTLFALGRDGTITALDAATGKARGAVPGHFDRLLAVAPW